MSKLIAQYATFGDYMAACDGDSSKRVAHYAEQERQAAEEAQQAKDAARWQFVLKNLYLVQSIIGRSSDATDFQKRVDIYIEADKEQ